MAQPVAVATRRVLIIEDETSIAGAIAARLRSEGYETAVAGDGLTGVELADTLRPDVVVLDLMLPGIDGLEVCRRIQKDRPVPVLMLTARDAETDVLVGLAVGADDYMTKPFSTRELVARVQALLRRVDRSPALTGPVPVDEVRIGTVVLHRGSRQVTLAGETVHLTPTEFDLLVHLATRPRLVFTREQLLAEVWGYRDGSGLRTVDSHVRAVRRKLGTDVIRTVHGVGYAIADPVGPELDGGIEGVSNEAVAHGASA